jgi:medium-chain acyl-[acyl-carrier-protein] hydrolase
LCDRAKGEQGVLMTRWIVRERSRIAPRLRLFCLPYAGAGASAFRSWSRHLGARVDVCAVQLPGRETRLADPAARRVADLVSTLATEMEALLDRPFALFGHSMGALLAFELARELRLRGGHDPEAVYLSGRSAPGAMPRRRPPLHRLPDADLRAHVGTMGGTPRALLEDPEMMQLLLPILRADFALCETHESRDAEPLRCPLVAFGGRHDVAVEPAGLAAWASHTQASFELHMFEGGHFYFNEDAGFFPTFGACLERAVGSRNAASQIDRMEHVL